MALCLTLPLWHDLHAHFRQGDDLMAALIGAHRDMGCAGILAMPNTKPPVSRVRENDPGEGWSIEIYRDMLRRAGGDSFDSVIVPLYLTQDTTPAMIAAGAKEGLLRAAKYYPPHGTTGAEFGAPLATYMANGVLAALRDHDVVLCVHGEEHDLSGEDYFGRAGNAEDVFYRERLPRVVDDFPGLKIVCEHVTTKTAADFVRKAPGSVAASVTPQHLIYTVGDMLKGFNYHLYCLPLIKFAEDRDALRAAVTAPGQKKFFAGTDSAPHAQKVTECGCAAGCYTGGIAPQLYAEAFEMAGVDLASADGLAAFRAFLCENGPRVYGLKSPDKTFTLEKAETAVEALRVGTQTITKLLLGMGRKSLNWRIIKS